MLKQHVESFFQFLSSINNKMRFLIKRHYVVDTQEPEELEKTIRLDREEERIVYNIPIVNSTVTIEEIPVKPTMDEIIAHYRTGLRGEDPICLVCDQVISGPYTDSQGQVRCKNCGATYQWQGCHLQEEFLREHNLRHEDIAQHYCDIFEYVGLLRLYWQEVHKRAPFGVYSPANNMITQDEINTFYSWLVKNADRFEPIYNGFNWAGIKREYAV